MEIRHERQGRGGVFLAVEDGAVVGEMTWGGREGGPMEVDHTWVDPRARGQGVARQLVDAGVAFARAEGRKILPLCSYVVRVFREDPSLADVAARWP